MKRLIIYTSTFTVLLLLACGDTTGYDSQWNATEPDMCIISCEKAFNDRNDGILETQITPDFTFHFAQSDIGETVNGYTIPSTWNYEQGLRAAANMLPAVRM